MQTTANYNLKKPENTDPVDIQDLNDNADILDEEIKKKVNASGGDISNTTIKTLDNITTEFPVPEAGEKPGTFLAKVRKFIQDFNNFKTGIITVGKLANNGSTTAAGMALDARYGKTLYDFYTQLNSDLVNITLASNLNTVGIAGKRILCKYDTSTSNTPYTEGLTGGASSGRVETYYSSMANGIQIAYPSGKNFIAIRNLANGAWGTWVKNITNANTQSGTILVSATANGTTEFSVTFPKAFAAPPVIVTSVVTSRSDLRNASPLSRTTTGFTGYLYNNSSAADISVFWIASTI